MLGLKRWNGSGSPSPSLGYRWFMDSAFGTMAESSMLVYRIVKLLVMLYSAYAPKARWFFPLVPEEWAMVGLIASGAFGNAETSSWTDHLLCWRTPTICPSGAQIRMNWPWPEDPIEYLVDILDHQKFSILYTWTQLKNKLPRYIHSSAHPSRSKNRKTSGVAGSWFFSVWVDLSKVSTELLRHLTFLQSIGW